ncbi:MAG: glutamine--fructose-6-phosphate transaminase (isomerizing) [Spirochaetota bacterium]|nr:MAG: glutamine--fructose-6-phosphate transaminase (isomerizing) [Spirochaetota bacterium]
MCGIVGYIGKGCAVPILVDGLKRLEYRGYDSAGIALVENGSIVIEKTRGKVVELEKLIANKEYAGTLGVAHTRWATHGVPNNTNAHPHTDCKNEIAIVHNGIIENYKTLKAYLEGKGHCFTSDTDTEVIVHLFEENHNGSLFDSICMTLSEIEGTYGLVIISKNEPDRMYAARKGSPLLIGKGDGEFIIASDVAAVVKHTKDIIYLDDGEIAEVRRDGFLVKMANKEKVSKKIQQITWDIEMIEKGGHPHFMLKEIHEQRSSLQNAIRGRLNPNQGTARLDGLLGYMNKLKNTSRIILTSCGTSWHAALIGEYLIEELAGIPCEVEYASEFRYRNPVVRKDDIVFVISQSGETADTLGALREAKQKGGTVLGICNVVGSTIARECDAGVYIHAGPEIGVASTKAFTSQVLVLLMVALMLGRMRSLSKEEGRAIVKEIESIPSVIEKVLKNDDKIKEIGLRLAAHNNALYLGRGYNFPVALEGALKLKEISYIHAEGYPAAEMKHGPIALIDENMPVIAIATKDITYEKIMSNISEIKARRGWVLSIVNSGDVKIKEVSDEIIEVPESKPYVTPIINVIPLQLLAYHVAVARGCNVDQPRNLAKSVTVE